MNSILQHLFTGLADSGKSAFVQLEDDSLIEGITHHDTPPRKLLGRIPYQVPMQKGLRLLLVLAALVVGITFILHYSFVLIKDSLLFQGEINVNEKGALLPTKSFEREYGIFLFNTSELWADTGIRVEKGDLLRISASGAFHSSVGDLYAYAKDNTSDSTIIHWNGGNDRFEGITPHASVPYWYLYRPRWADVYADGHSLCLTDSDPYDYARAIRVFEAGKKIDIRMSMKVVAESSEQLEIDVTDRHGERMLSLSLSGGTIRSQQKTLAVYRPDEWIDIHLTLDTDNNIFTCFGQTLPALHAVKSVERLSLRTGAWRNLPDRKTPNQDKQPPLPQCDERVTPSMYQVKYLQVNMLR